MQEILLGVSDFILDPFAGKSWTAMPNNPTAVPYFHFPVVTDDNYLYCIGGVNGNNAFNRLHRYDGSVWSTLANIPMSLYGSCACLYNGEIYVFGGAVNNTTNAVVNAYKYNIANNQWTTLANMPITIMFGNAVVINNEIYLFTGADQYLLNNHNWPHIFYKYNPALNTYTQMENPPISPRYLSGVTVSNNKIYVIGGRINNVNLPENNLKDFWCYDPSNDQWTQLLEIDTAVFSAWGSLSKYDNNRLILMSRAVSTTAINTSNEMFIYDIRINKWKRSSANMFDRRHYNFPIKFKNSIINTNGLVLTNNASSQPNNCYRMNL